MPTTHEGGRLIPLLSIAATAILLSHAALWAASPARAQETPEASAAPRKPTGPVNAVGYEIDLDNLPSPHPRPSETVQAPASDAGRVPLYVRVGIPWAAVEKSVGLYDWSVADEIVLSHAGAGYAVILHPRGDNPLYAPLSGQSDPSVDAWGSFLRALASRYEQQAQFYLLGGRIQDRSAREWAYLVKLSSVMIQSADRGARIAFGDLDLSQPDAGALLESLYGEGVAAYLDALALTDQGDPASIKAQMLLHDPGAALWLVGRQVPGGLQASGRLLRGYLEGLEHDAALSLFTLDFGPDGMPLLRSVLERIRDIFLPSFTPLVETGRGIQVMTPMGQAVPVKTVRLFDPDAKKVLIAYDAGEGATRGAQAVIVVDTVDLAEPVLKDVAAGETGAVGGYQKDESVGVTRLAVPLADYPLLLEYRRFTSPLFGEGEKLEVTGVRLPSVEEILANHQAFQAAQDALLINTRADARIDYHFRIGAGSTSIDVTILSAFYYDPKVGAEFEQKEFLVNGVKWRSNRIPEFPLPQPEKVLTLPLDISLDKRYAYRLAGEETVDGYDCWAIEFEPLSDEGNLYKGRVWIDKATFARVQISSVQTGLEPPIISNDEKDSYRPVRGPEGLEYWLLRRIEGQQVFTTTGRNLILVREVTLTDHAVNDPKFETLHKQAYASDHQMLRDTPAGQRYLERTPEGGRVVKEELDRDNLFLLGGVLYNQSLDFPVPLAGINYFNRDLGGRGIQTNVFFAGVLLFANASDPDLFGVGLESSLDVVGQGFSSTDKPVREGEEVEEENVDLTTQRLVLGLGLPFAQYWKVKLSGILEFQGFAHDEETSRDFDIPQDTYVGSVDLEGEFNRRSWSVTASVRSSSRQDWEPWGFPLDPNAPAAVKEALEESFETSKDFLQYQGKVAKDFFLPLNQKILTSVSLFGGSDLDRFSQYRFDFFGNRLRGFSGTGLRYGSGATARLQYAFNLGSLIRFDAAVDHARVKDRLDASGDYKNFTGFGLSGQTIVGPNLLVNLDWGIALASDVDKFKGDQEILLTILRLFR